MNKREATLKEITERLRPPPKGATFSAASKEAMEIWSKTLADQMVKGSYFTKFFAGTQFNDEERRNLKAEPFVINTITTTTT